MLIDINQEKTDGEAKDIRHGLPGIGTADLYAGDYSDCADCDLIIITAGRGRKPGESRLDLTNENAKIMISVIDSIHRFVKTVADYVGLSTSVINGYVVGEHGCREVALSVPSVVGPAGVQQRIREKWAPDEYRGFFDAVENVRSVLEKISI